jgi:hypothetical protein
MLGIYNNHSSSLIIRGRSTVDCPYCGGQSIRSQTRTSFACAGLVLVGLVSDVMITVVFVITVVSIVSVIGCNKMP